MSRAIPQPVVPPQGLHAGLPQVVSSPPVVQQSGDIPSIIERPGVSVTGSPGVGPVPLGPDEPELFTGAMVRILRFLDGGQATCSERLASPNQ